jgi:two-component system response regulator FixJ
VVSMPFPHRQYPSGQAQKLICIVDDDAAVAESLATLLESFGFNVLSYSSGIEFLADERRHTAGCLMIDQHMPGMTGLDVISNLQTEGVQVSVILMSGRFEPDTRACAARLGVRQLLEKPFAAGRLIELVRAMVSEID